MSRYIDADARDNTSTSRVIPPTYKPTADVVKVVRCRDCTWWKSIFSWNGKEHKVCVRESAEPQRESDDYCSYGERREDAEAVDKKN